MLICCIFGSKDHSHSEMLVIFIQTILLIALHAYIEFTQDILKWSNPYQIRTTSIYDATLKGL